MKILIAAIGLLLCFSLASTRHCQGDSTNDLLLTGAVEFSNSYNDIREKCFSRHIDFLTAHNSYRKGQAIAVPASFEGFSHAQGADFSIQVGFKDQNTMSIIYLADSGSDWRKVSINYLVTARDDIWAGSFSVSSFPFLGCYKNERNSIVAQGEVTGLRQKYNTNAVVFISAIRTESKKFYIDLKGVSVNPSTGVLSVEVFSNAAIEVLQLSYVVYTDSTPFNIEVLPYSRIEEVKEATYGVAGLNQITKSAAIEIGLVINSKDLTCHGSGCTKECVSVPLCERLGGTVFERYCLICKAGEVLVNNECVPACRDYEVYVHGKCQCADGYVEVDGWCKKICASNAYYDHQNRCVCLPGYFEYYGACKEIPTCGHYE